MRSAVDVKKAFGAYCGWEAESPLAQPPVTDPLAQPPQQQPVPVQPPAASPFPAASADKYKADTASDRTFDDDVFKKLGL